MAVTNNIIQIEEFTLTPGLTDIIYSVSGILPNALIGIYCDKYGVYPIDCKRDNNSIHITYEPQETTMHVALFFLLDDLIIENNLLSDSETHALSAAQGKALKALIDNIHVTASLSDLTDVEVENLQTDDILIYDAIEEKWINASLPSVPESINDLSDVDITSPSNGQVLSYNNGEWINANVSAGGGVDYSTTEQDTGLKWIDGKSIYQCSYNPQQTFSIGSTWTNIIPLSGIETLINLQLTLQIDIENRLRWEYYQGYLKAVSISGSVSLPNPVITLQYTKEVI